MNYPRSKGWQTTKLQRPTITARPSEHVEITADISIQALAIHPELLPRTVPKKSKKAHDTACECEECEHGEELRELDF